MGRGLQKGWKRSNGFFICTSYRVLKDETGQKAWLVSLRVENGRQGEGREEWRYTGWTGHGKGNQPSLCFQLRSMALSYHLTLKMAADEHDCKESPPALPCVSCRWLSFLSLTSAPPGFSLVLAQCDFSGEVVD